MQEMLGTLGRDPSRLDRLIARPETWRTPMKPQAELVERTPIPRVAQSALRTAFARRPKPAVDPVPDKTQFTEQNQNRSHPLKLYQPAHQRFYLVGASLVCGIPGLPDRAVTRGGAEQVNFVVRRLLPPTPNGDDSDLREYAFVNHTAGGTWCRVDAPTLAAADKLVPGEELLPVFPLAYDDDGSHARTLWTGFVPVGRREEYITAKIDRSPAASFAAGQLASLAVNEPSTPPNSTQARIAQFQAEVAEPWKNLIRSSYKTADSLTTASKIKDNSEPTGDQQARVFNFNLQQQQASWLILLDFADYLAVHLPDLWKAITKSGAGFSNLSTEQQNLYTWLGNATMSLLLKDALNDPATGSPNRPASSSLRDALIAVSDDTVRLRLEQTELLYTKDSDDPTSTEWPNFHFLLAGVNSALSADGPFSSLDSLTTSVDSKVDRDPDNIASDFLADTQRIDQLTTSIARSLTPNDEALAPPRPFALQVRDALTQSAKDVGRFVIRFVYTNRDCGPVHPPKLSAPSQRFQLASFFDVDAPARPIRITLPTDTTPAGLRKAHKNTALVLSDVLCGQVQRAKGLGFIDLVLAVLPWPLHKDLDVGSGGSCKGSGVDIGMICSLSIPIITICALILLIIIVSLLDLIFHWLPFFILCFPVLNLKGKKATP